MNKEPQPEDQNRYRPDLQRVVVGALATMALMNAAPAPAEAERAKVNEKLTLVEDLPGIGIEVSKESQKHLRAATVKIVNRKKPYPGVTYTEPRPWYDNCTGVKVSLNGKKFVSTALHCFAEETGSTYGVISGSNFKGNPLALDFINGANNEIAIVDPLVEPEKRQVLGKVTSILGSTQKKDLALLNVKPLGNEKQPPRTLGEVPSIKLLNDSFRPKPGQKVRVISAPRSRATNADTMPESGRMQENDGVYLGRTTDPATYATVDLVGIKAKFQSKEACITGGSGGSFVATVRGEDVASGPMSIRYNRTSDTKTQGDGWKYHWEFLANSLGRDLQRNGVKNARGVDLIKSDFTTLCTFTVRSETALKNIAAATGKYPQPKNDEFGTSPVGEVK